MAIYRGPGGAGDATTDSSTEAAAAVNAAAQAATSATQAASSATQSANSATAASSSASSASTSASTATTKANEAASSASDASVSALAASTSATNAAASASTATTQANNASTSATSASTSASTAQSAATLATSKATDASNAASVATTKASEASTSASNAATSETNAASSASSASTSASTATTQASNAATSATAAAASASTATTKASEAATSATNAATSATNAANSATAAATSATNASNSASAASTSATNAASSATSAASSATAAAASYDSFDDRYLGSKSSAPTLDNDGNALLTGALYFDTTSNSMKVYNGTAWLDAYASLSGALLATNNLSDLNSVSTARTNLGLGTAATTAATDYATAAQGTKADTAYGWGNHASAGYAADSLVAHLAGTETITGAKTFSSTITGSITGNAGTVTNGVYTSGSYADPTWLTSIAGSKVSGNISGNAATATTATNQSGGTVAATTLSASSTVTLSGGTANGVAYLNGSKVLTTGSALTFDGTTLNFGGTAQRITGDFSNGTTTNRLMFQSSTTNGVTSIDAIPNGTQTQSQFTALNSSDSANASNMQIVALATESRLSAGARGTGTYQPMTFYTNGSEQMRLTSTGLGIGTSSPSYKLSVSKGSAGIVASFSDGVAQTLQVSTGTGYASLLNANNGAITFRNYSDSAEFMRLDSSGNLGIGTSSPGTKLSVNGSARLIGTSTSSVSLGFGTDDGVSGWSIGNGIIDNTHNFRIYDNTAGAARLTLDGSGNLGLGVTPSAWTLLTVTQIKNASYSGYSNYAYMSANAFYSSGAWKYIASDYAAQYVQNVSGQHQWYTAPSGTAGNAISFTQAMTLDASGNLGIGTATPGAKLHVSGGTIIAATGTESYLENRASSANYILFENAGGSAAGYIAYSQASNYMAFSANGSERMRIDSSGNVGIGTSSPGYKLQVQGNGFFNGILQCTGNFYTTGSLISSNSSANPLTFGINDAEKMRIDSSGNVLVGTSTAYGKFAVVGTNFNFSLRDDISNYCDLASRGASTTYGGFVFKGIRDSDGAEAERMRIDSSGNLLFNSGYGSAATAYGCRAWVNFNGTGTVAIRGSGNVSSITDNGVGYYQANFATAMPDTNYSAVALSGFHITSWGLCTNGQSAPYSTTYYRVNVLDNVGNTVDNTYVSINIFR